jgi:hypothetical protein
MTDLENKVPEPEHKGSIWTHPYLLYILLTVLLFGILCAVAYFCYQSDWIPSRGVSG